MARPRKSEGNNRGVMVSFRLQPEELETVNAQAKKARMHRSDYLRRIALEGKVRVEKHEAPAFSVEAVRELNRIGVNLNQLTRLAHTTGEVPPEVRQLCSQIEKLIAEAVEPR